MTLIMRGLWGIRGDLDPMAISLNGDSSILCLNHLCPSGSSPWPFHCKRQETIVACLISFSSYLTLKSLHAKSKGQMLRGTKDVKPPLIAYHGSPTANLTRGIVCTEINICLVQTTYNQGQVWQFFPKLNLEFPYGPATPSQQFDPEYTLNGNRSKFLSKSLRIYSNT